MVAKPTYKELEKKLEELENCIQQVRTSEKKNSEQMLRYKTLFEAAGNAIFIIENEKFIECNEMALKIFRCEQKKNIIGRHFWDFSPPIQPDNSNSELKAKTLFCNALKGKPDKFFWQHSRKDGTLFDAEVSLNTINLNDKTQLQAIVRDITEEVVRKTNLLKSNRALNMLSLCNQQAMESEDETTLLANVCRIIIENGGYQQAWAGYVEDDKAKTVQPAAQKGFKDGYLEGLNITWADTGKGKGPIGSAVFTGKPAVFNKVAEESFFDLWRQESIEYGYHAVIAVPLKIDETPIGVMNIYSEKSDAFDTDEVKLLNQIADSLSCAIQEKRLVFERNQAFEALQNSERKFRQFAENIDVVIFITDPERRTLQYVNSAYERLWEASCVSLYENPKSFMAKIHSEDRDSVEKAILKQRQGNNVVVEYRIVRKDGTFRWIRSQAFPHSDNRGRVLQIFGIADDITDLKEKEAVIRESQERYQGLFYDSPMPMFEEDFSEVKINIDQLKKKGITDIRAFYETHPDELADCISKIRITEINNALIMLYKATSREDLLSRIDVVFGEEMHSGFIEGFVAIALGRTAFEQHLVLRTLDGNLLRTHIKWQVAQGHEEKYDKVFITVDDITQLKEAETELKKSEENYRVLVENQTDLVVKVDRKGRLLFVNPPFCRLFGKTEKELVGNDLMPLIHEEDKGKTTEAMAHLHQPPYTCYMEQRAMTRFGWRWLGWSDKSVLDGNGDVVAIIRVGRDVTERKQMEDALRKSEIMHKSLFENAGDAIFLTDMNGAFYSVNEKGCEHLGYTRKEILGMTFCQIEPEANAPLIEKRLRDIIEGGQLVYETTYIRKDGTVIYVEANSRMIAYNSHFVILTIARDITKRWEIQTERDRLEKQVRQTQKLEALGTLAGGIAHDFNNILTAILGYTELAQSSVEKSSPISGYMKGVFDAGLRARDLVTQILAFCRQTQTEVRLVYVKVIAKEVAKLLRASLPTSIEIRSSINSEGLIMGDPTSIHQIFMNLCTNASHAMGENGVLEIEVSDITLEQPLLMKQVCLLTGQYVKIEISDTGHGIHPEIIDFVFDPYFTTKDQGEGTGLGLSVVHGIVKSYGGEIFLNSEVGKGTTFTIYLPKVIKEKAEPEKDEKPVPKGTEHILVVDDELSIAKIVARLLTGIGYKITTRTSSIEALECFRYSPDKFDMVMTDMSMPNMRGDKLAEEILKIRPEIPVIICTGFSKKITEERIEELGIREIILKPFVKQDLAEKIRKVFDENQKSE